MKKILLAVAVLSAVTLSIDAKKKDKKADAEVLYGIKSGIITTQTISDMDFSEMNFGGFGGGAGAGAAAGMPMFNPSEAKTYVYFDDYGRKTCTVNDYGTSRTRTLTVGENTVTIDLKARTGTSMPNFGGRGGFGGFGAGGGMMNTNTRKPIDFMNLTEKEMKKNKITHTGEEQIAGVTCQKYDIKTNMMGQVQTQHVWVYKGIILKTESTNEFTGTMGSVAIAIQENVQIPDSMFVVPADVKVTERNFGGMGGFGGGMGDFGGGMGGFGGGGMGGFGGGMGGGFGGF